MCYYAYGLRIESDIPLPELPVAADKQTSKPADLVIRRGVCPSSLDSSPQHNPSTLEDGSLLLDWADIGRFWMRGGREIIVEPAQRVAESLLRAVLLGPVLAMLLFQRGYLVLHASAVAMQSGEESRGVAFLGHSTQGKSTMATALVKHGHLPLADDIIAVPIPQNQQAVSGEGEPLLIHAALPHLKLRPPSVRALDENLASLSLWRPDEDGYVLPLADFPSSPAPLKSIYVLEEGPLMQIEELEPEQALSNLLDHCYCIRSADGVDLGGDFLKCAELIRHVPIFRLRRPKDFGLLPDVVRLVEKHQQKLTLQVKIQAEGVADIEL